MLAAAAFAALMAPLGPFTPDRRVAVAVSGGADSLALAVLTAGWGRPLALVADHGLRPGSDAEARLTIDRLTARGIPARLITLRIAPGPGLAERARVARYRALTAACADAGLPQLLVGHHAGDQAETVLLRALHGSGPDGRAGMAALQPAGGIVLLRPLLDVPPVWLRQTLRAVGLAWIEDPSNHDPAAERVRLRRLIGDAEGTGRRTAALLDAGRYWRERRAAAASAASAWLSMHAMLHAGLHAEVPDGALPARALSALIQSVTGAAYPPPAPALRRLAAEPRPATLAGARLLRRRGGLTIAREAAAMAPPRPALPGAVWDGRFAIDGVPAAGTEATIGGLGDDAAAWRNAADLPAAVLATLPCLRAGGAVVAIPHLGVGDPGWRLRPVINRAATSSLVNCAPPV